MSNEIILIIAMFTVSCLGCFGLGIHIGLQMRQASKEESLAILYQMATEDKKQVRRDMEQEEFGDVDVDSWNEAHVAGKVEE